MSARIRFAILALAASLSLHVAGAAETREASVTYFTGSTVYIDAGSQDGLVEGDRLQILRDGAVVAIAEVKDVSTRRAACTIVSRTLDPAVGDLVQIPLRPPAEPAPVVFDSDDEAPVVAGGKRRGNRLGISGRVGVRYLVVRDLDSDFAGYSQPALDLQVGGAQIGGSAWGFAIDARARRTYRTLADGTDGDDGRTRLYRAAVFRTGIRDNFDFALGRQSSPAFAAVSIFDGLSASYHGKRWRVGLFSGTQPDPLTFDYSTEIREHGFFGQFFGRSGTRGSWQVTTGVIGSYDNSEINREFWYVQGRYSDTKLSLFLTQEVDFNRGWKAEEGQETVSPTGTLLSLNYRVSRVVSFNGGYDNRRSVRLYRDRVTPVTEFDDAYRRGVWAGTSLYFANRYRLGLGARTNQRGDAGDAESFDLLFGVDRISRANISVGSRTTYYTNEMLDGTLLALTVGAPLGRRVFLQAEGGMRAEETRTLVPTTNDVTWYGLNLDVNLGRRWFAFISVDRTSGDLENFDQLYTTLSYRF